MNINGKEYEVNQLVSVNNKTYVIDDFWDDYVVLTTKDCEKEYKVPYDFFNVDSVEFTYLAYMVYQAFGCCGEDKTVVFIGTLEQAKEYIAQQCVNYETNFFIEGVFIDNVDFAKEKVVKDSSKLKIDFNTF